MTAVAFGSAGDPSNVEVIEHNAFEGNDLGSVALPDSLIDVHYQAFWFAGITELTFGSRLEDVGNHAFSYNSLTSFALPASIVQLGNDAFNVQESPENGPTLRWVDFHGGPLIDDPVCPSSNCIYPAGEPFESLDSAHGSFTIKYLPRFHLSQGGLWDGDDWKGYPIERVVVRPVLEITRHPKVNERAKFTVRVKVHDGWHAVEGGKVRVKFKGKPGKPPKIRTVEAGEMSTWFRAPSVGSTRRFKIIARYLPDGAPYKTSKTSKYIKVLNR